MRMPARLRKWWTPATAAFVIGPSATELLSGNTPPLAFFNPVVFLLFSILYGGGVLLAHDFVVKRRRGWPSLVALAIAYGIFEEAIVTRAWFNVNWADLGKDGNFVWWLETSWIEAIRLTAYHATFAILIPVFLIGLIFPQRRDTPWLSPKQHRITALLFFSLAPLGLLIMPFRPPIVPYAAAWAVFGLLIVIARWLPIDTRLPRTWTMSRRRTFLSGMGAATGLFVTGWILPAASAPAFVSVPLLTGGIVFVAWRLIRARPGEPELMMLVAGALGYWVAVAPLLELTGRLGMLMVAIITAVLLRRFVRRIPRTEVGEGQPLGPLTLAMGD